MQVRGTNLAVKRGGRPVFSGLSFAVSGGELLAVTGPNGAGKSTLLRLVAGLLRPASGAIAVEPAAEEGLGRRVHYLGHLDGLKPALSLFDNLAFWRLLEGGDAEIGDALAAVGLDGLERLPVAVLSAGQKRRAALARLLLAPRPVWLLDEPLTALDSDAEAMLGRLMAGQRDGGGIVIAATHRDLPVTPTATLALPGRA